MVRMTRVVTARRNQDYSSHTADADVVIGLRGNGVVVGSRGARKQKAMASHCLPLLAGILADHKADCKAKECLFLS